MRGRFLVAAVLFAVAFGGGALALSRRNHDGRSSAKALPTFDEEVKYVTASGLQMQSLTSSHIQLTMKIDVEGDSLSIVEDMSLQNPDRGYGSVLALGGKSLGKKTEFAIVGPDGFRREDGGSWTKMPLSALGFDASSMYKNFDIVSAASAIDQLPNVKEKGVDLRHLHVRFDGPAYKSVMKDLYLPGSNASDALHSMTISEIAADYFIRVSDGLPQRSEVFMDYSVYGHRAKMTAAGVYSDFNVPVKLPADLPK